MSRRLVTAGAVAILSAVATGGVAVAAPAEPQEPAAVAGTWSLVATGAQARLPQRVAQPVLSRNLIKAARARKTVVLDWSPDRTTRLHAQVRYAPRPALSLSLAGARVVPDQLILVDGVLYMRTGQAAGRPWTRVDPASDQFSRDMVANMGVLADPVAVATPLRGGVATAAPGPVLEGARTTVYTVRLSGKPLATALAGLTPTLREMVTGTRGALTSLVVRYSVDATWLLHRVVTVATVGGRSVTQTITASRWGRPVTIVAPPASQVAPPSGGAGGPSGAGGGGAAVR